MTESIDGGFLRDHSVDTKIDPKEYQPLHDTIFDAQRITEVLLERVDDAIKGLKCDANEMAAMFLTVRTLLNKAEIQMSEFIDVKC